MLSKIKNFIYSDIRFKNVNLLLIILLVAILSRGCNKKLIVINGCAIQPDTVCFNANLDLLNLEGVNLKGANLEGASLRGTNLKGANLEGAILRNVRINSAYLDRGEISANIEKTNFKNSFIFNSRIDAVGIKKANFKGAVICQVQFPDGDNNHSGCNNYKKFKTHHQLIEYGVIE